MGAVSTLALEVGMAAACAALGLPRATVYRHCRRAPETA
jgi:hypothetical protein